MAGGFRSSSEFYRWVAGTLARAGRMTPSEREVCEYLVLGRQYRDIARIRAVSIETIRWQVKEILRKLGVETSRELIWAIGQAIDCHDRGAPGDRRDLGDD